MSRKVEVRNLNEWKKADNLNNSDISPGLEKELDTKSQVFTPS